jgi:hypothetical protein
MNTLLLRLARVDRQGKDWLRTVQRDGFTDQAHYKGQRLAASFDRLDSLATSGPKALEAILLAHAKLHHILEQIEALRETLATRVQAS